MNELKKYLSSLTAAQREDFALRCSTTCAHLRNVAYGFRTANTQLSVSIERESGGVVTRKHLHPCEWAGMWPELSKESADV